MRKTILSLSIAVLAVLFVTGSYGEPVVTGQIAVDTGTTMTANGLVTLAIGPTLRVLSQPKGEVTVQTDAFTVIRKQGQQITATQITAGDFVNCLGTRVDDQTMKAQQIEVRGDSKK